MIRSIPTINTARLALRAMRLEDFDRYCEIFTAEASLRVPGGNGRNRRSAWESFLRNTGHWHLTGFGQWAVTEQRTRMLIGQAGFFYGSDEVDAEFDAYPQAGWLFAEGALGQGLAAEAVQAAHDWFDRVIAGPMVIRIKEDDAGAQRLTRMLGYRPLAATGGEEAGLLMRRDRPPSRL